MRVLLADDHDLLRDTLSAFLAGEDGIILDTVGSLEAAMTEIDRNDHYELVLLDYRMPGMNGLDGLRRTLGMKGGQRVALFTGQANRDIAEEALQLGAAGFLPKTLPAKSLVNAVRFMAMGETYAPVSYMTAADEAQSHPIARKLTMREMQVLKGVTAGQSNKEIARDLDLTEPTIKLHMKTLYRKLEVCNRTQAAIVARDAGLF